MEMGNEEADDGEMEDDGSRDSEEENDSNEASDEDDSESTPLVDENLQDEIDGFGYSGLDQVEEDAEWEEDHLGEDGLGAEDGENMDWELEEEVLAHAYL